MAFARTPRLYSFLKLFVGGWLVLVAAEASFFVTPDLVNGRVGVEQRTPETNMRPNAVLLHGRQKRYVLSKEKWPTRTLRWKLHKNRLATSDLFIIRATLHRAFDIWSTVSSLKFIEVIDADEYADIDILFLKGKHGDGLPFDGPMGIVAHAFYPPVGALHFDADENWTLNREDGINFYQTAVHEIGHLLGLEHSTDYRAVMYPRNRKFEIDFQLADDDVRGIRRLYPLEKNRKS